MSITPQDLLKRQLDFTNVSKYHEQGYAGKGLVAFNSESHIGESNKHGRMTNMVLHQFAPDITIVNGTTGGRTSGSKVVEYYVVTTDGDKYDFEEFIKKFNIKLMTTSLGTAQANKAIQDYLKGVQERTGLIQFCGAGNEGSDGADGKYVKNDTAVAVGAGYIYDDGRVDTAHYSAIDAEVDFIAPMGTYSGTSAASPALTGMTACLLSKFGDFNQKECVEILKSISMDIGVEGKDPKYGWGLPILPLGDELEIIVGGTSMEFKDLKEKNSSNEWYYDSVQKCVDVGLLQGYEDNTFRPTYKPTRAEWSVVLAKLLDKMNGQQ